MSEESAWAQVDKLSDEVERLRRILRQDEVGPQEGDRVRLTYGDGSSVEGTWRAVLGLDDGTLHTHTRGQVRRDVLPPLDESPSPSA